MSKHNFYLQPLPPPPGVIDPYGDPFGSTVNGSISSGRGTGKYTLQPRQILTVSCAYNIAQCDIVA